MRSFEPHPFVEQYLQFYGAQIDHQTPDTLEATLPAELDQELFPRPFLWALQSEPAPPVQRTFHFSGSSPHALCGDSPLLHNFLRSAQQKGRFACLYEKKKQNQAGMSYLPWLLLVFRVTYRCDRHWQRLFPWAISRTTGAVISAPQIQATDYQGHPAPGCAACAAQLSMLEAVGMLETCLTQALEAEPQAWAQAASARLQAAQEELSSLQLADEEYEQRCKEQRAWHQPSLKVDMAAAAALYRFSAPRSAHHSS